MRPGRAALAALVVAGLLAGMQGHSRAQPPEGEGPRPPAEANHVNPGSAEKPVEDGEQRRRLVSILGRELTNRDGDGGRVIDVLIDLDGGPGAVVIEFGGFMGIGSRKVAVEWKALHFVREGDRSLLTVDITREQIRDAAEYTPNEPPSVLMAQ